MSTAFIIILGGIFLTVVVAAIYILVDKKVISNPLDYISSVFSPNGVGTTDATGGTSEDNASGTDEYEGGESSEYVDKFSPNKIVKGQYIWITRANANSTAYRNAMQGSYGIIPTDTYSERAPISLTEIVITDKDDEIFTSNTLIVSDTSGDIGETDTKYLFNSDIDAEGEDKSNRVTSRGSTALVDYLKMDLKSIKTISSIQLDSLYDTEGVDAVSNKGRWDFNLLGVYIIITKQNDINRPVAITPIIKRPGTSHVFSFPGTEWDTDTEDELKLKFDPVQKIFTAIRGLTPFRAD
jgi:hypothetical protein